MVEHKKVLIVDQSPVFRNALRDVIKAEETHVDISEAQTVNQALEIVKNGSLDMVISDIELPGESGLYLLEKLSRLTPDTCIVVLTSNDSTEYKKASIQGGADYFLSKEKSSSLGLREILHERLH